jgi:hypothetical protein
MIGYAPRAGCTVGPRRTTIRDRAPERGECTRIVEGELVDVCESTARMTSLEQYVRRAAILGPDPRGGAMAMLFATERMQGAAHP